MGISQLAKWMAGTTILKVSTVTMNFDVNVVSTGKKKTLNVLHVRGEL